MVKGHRHTRSFYSGLGSRRGIELAWHFHRSRGDQSGLRRL